MNTEVTLRKSNIIWTAVDSLLFIRNFNKGQRKKTAVQQRASPALAQLLHKMWKFQNEKANTTLYSRKEGRDVSSQSLEIANSTLMKCKHSPPHPPEYKSWDPVVILSLWNYFARTTYGVKSYGCWTDPQQQQTRTASLMFTFTFRGCCSGRVHRQTANRSQLGVLQFGKTHGVNSASTNQIC